MIVVHDMEQGSEEWKLIRANKFTGSNADKLLKHGAIDYSLTETGKFKGNFYTKRGHILEEEAIEIYELIRKTSVERPGFVTNTKWPNCGYSPDGLRPDRTIEVKAFGREPHLQLINGEIPLKVLAQCHFGMLICEKKICDLIPYNPDIEDPKKAFRIVTIKWNPKVAANFKRILTKPSLLGVT